MGASQLLPPDPSSSLVRKSSFWRDAGPANPGFREGLDEMLVKVESAVSETQILEGRRNNFPR